MRKIASFLLVVGLTCCNNPETRESSSAPRDFILQDKELVPEGITFDSRTSTAFVGSMYKRKILAIDENGAVNDFVPSMQDSLWSVLGMKVDEKRRLLWAVSSQVMDIAPLINPDSMQWRSALHCYDIDSRKLVKRIVCRDTGIFLNDIALSKTGDVFITESIRNRLYYLKAGTEIIERFLIPDSTWFMNGICFSEDEKHLYLGCWNGLMKVDVSNRSYQWVRAENGTNASGIDGLSWYQNSLIAHQGDKICRLYFNADHTAIVRADTLTSGHTDMTTTGAIGGNDYYFIVNSQVQTAYDMSKKVLKPLDSLETVIIRRISLHQNLK